MAVASAIRKRAKLHNYKTPQAAVVNEGYASTTYTLGTIKAHVQPLSGKELRDVPEGQNATDMRNVWSETQMAVRDLIEIDGLDFEIKNVQYWDEGRFWWARAAKAKDQL